MKRSLLFVAVATALVAATSCSEKTPDVTGTWQGVPEKINVPGSATATGVTAITFTPDGNVTLNTTVDFTEPVNAQEQNLDLYQVSLAANATISGTYKFVDREDDEIDITFDNETLTVGIDPAAVAFSENMVNGKEQPEIDNLKAYTVEKYQMSLTPAMKAYYAKYLRLDDVKVKDGVLKFELNDVDYYFHK